MVFRFAIGDSSINVSWRFILGLWLGFPMAIQILDREKKVMEMFTKEREIYVEHVAVNVLCITCSLCRRLFAAHHFTLLHLTFTMVIDKPFVIDMNG